MLVGRDFFLVLVVSRVGQELSRLGQNQGVGAIHGCQRCFFFVEVDTSPSCFSMRPRSLDIARWSIPEASTGSTNQVLKGLVMRCPSIPAGILGKLGNIGKLYKYIATIMGFLKYSETLHF